MYSLVSVLWGTVAVLLGVAFLTLLERKALSYSQLRKGPNKVGGLGLLQPFSDMVSLLGKAYYSLNLTLWGFSLAPILTLLVFLSLWGIAPPVIFFLPCAWFIYLFMMAILTFLLIFLGLSGMSFFSFTGGLRAMGQVLAYEVILVFCLLSNLILSATCGLSAPLYALALALPVALITLISGVAESSRTPFDFAEGESELVSGFNTEYGSSSFTLIFLVEYGMLMFMGLVVVTMLVSFRSIQWLGIALWSCLAIWIRGSYPRHRYDLLMVFSWVILAPLSTLLVAIILLIC